MDSKRVKDSVLIILIGLTVMGIFLSREWLYNHSRLGVPLDDSWIHYRFASNLAQGNGFVYNIGEPVSGSTSPLWVFLLAGVSLLSGEFLITSKLLSGLFFLFSAVGIYCFALKQGSRRKIAFCAALLTIIAGRFAWAALSGMEITFFAFLSIVAILKHCSDKEKNRKSVVAPILFGVASLVRPEGYALFAFAILDNFIQVKHSTHKTVILRFGKVSLVQILIYLLIISPYLIFSFYTTGHFLPQTFYAQSELFGLVNKLDYIKLYLVNLWDDNPFLFFFIPIGMGITFQTAINEKSQKTFCNSLLILLWIVGYPLLALFIAPNVRHYHRYMMPLIPLYILIALYGFDLFLHHSERYFNRLEVILFQKRLPILSKHFATSSLALIIALALYLTVNIWSKKFASDVANINSQQVAMGEWVKVNIPRDRLIALSDIGAVTYIAERKKIVDMVGLVNPELLTFIKKTNKNYQDALLHFLCEKRPDYVITYPGCYPLLVENKNVFLEIHSVRLDKYSGITAGKKMAVYKTYWDNYEDRGMQ